MTLRVRLCKLAIQRHMFCCWTLQGWWMHESAIIAVYGLGTYREAMRAYVRGD